MQKNTLKKYKINKDDLLSQGSLPGLEKLSRDVIKYNYVEDAYDLLRMLDKQVDEEKIKQGDPVMYKKYLLIKRRFSFIALLSLTEEEALAFYRSNFVRYLDNEHIDIFAKTRARLISLPIDFRNAFKQKIINTLKQNKENIGSKNIGLQGKTVPSLVKHWVTDYNQFLGAGKRDKLERFKYLNESPNCQGLSREDKNLLHDLFYFHDVLKISSYEVGALDNWGTELFTPFVESAESKRLGETREVREITAGKPGRAGAPPSTQPRPTSPPTAKAGAGRAQEGPPVATPPQPRPSQPEVVDLKKDEPAEMPPQPAPAKPAQTNVIEISSHNDIAGISPSSLRQLADDPHQAAEKIKQQVFKLIGASPQEKSLAKEAWQKSPLYKLYIIMGEESMKSRKPIKEVSQELKNSNRPNLSEKEFKAVVEISRIF